MSALALLAPPLPPSPTPGLGLEAYAAVLSFSRGEISGDQTQVLTFVGQMLY